MSHTPFIDPDERVRLARIGVALLRHKVHRPQTMTAYRRGYELYRAFCSTCPPHSHHRYTHPHAVSELDVCMETYIGWLFATYQGRGRHNAVNAVYGLYTMFPQYQRQLRRSEQLLLAWSHATPPRSHPPLTWPLTVLMATSMARSGETGCALATVVGFHTMLRGWGGGELVSVRVRDVSLPGDPRRGDMSSASSRRVCIRLPTTKTGDNQWAELYDGQVSALIARLYNKVRHYQSSFLFDMPCSASIRSRTSYYRSVFHQATATHSLHSDPPYTPHSLRHGGATYAHQVLQQTIETIMHRGRWQSNNNARMYIQSGAASLVQQRIPDDAHNRASILLVNWDDILAYYCFPDAVC